MKCFFHKTDLDGMCAGAIVKYFLSDCKMIGINYGEPFPWEIIGSKESVYMVDFTLQPFDDMERLAKMCRLVWIDHHKTEIDEANLRGFNPGGIRRLGIGACALAWEYFAPSEPMPYAVKQLALYDVFNTSDKKTLPFQYGFRLFSNAHPDQEAFWKLWIEGPPQSQINDVVCDGVVILEYEKSVDAKYCQMHAFETFIDNHRAIAINRGLAGSKIFASVYDPKSHDLMLAYVRLPNAHWTVGLYSDKPEIDCGKIARKFGGGGHSRASGFQCSGPLPFPT